MCAKLVIAEKPSVAQSIAAALGVKGRNDGYIEDNGYIVSWCYGHLAELSDAAAYNEDYAKWKLSDLPIIPQNFRFTLAQDKKKQFDVLRTLLRRKDVNEVVNACDAGREGELIFRTVYHLAGCSKPMKRLWISSMEETAIRARAFKSSGTVKTMTGCIRPRCAAPKRIGWWASTPPAISRWSTARN